MDRLDVYLDVIRELILIHGTPGTPSTPGTTVYLVDVHGLRVVRDLHTCEWKRVRGTKLQYTVDAVIVDGSDDIIGLCGLYPDMTKVIQTMFSQKCRRNDIRVILNLNAYYKETSSYADIVQRRAWSREFISDAIVICEKK